MERIVKEHLNNISNMVNMDKQQIKQIFITSTKKYKIHRSNADKWLEEYKKLQDKEKYLFWFVLDGFCGGHVAQALREVK
ncbi:hypothetical protein [Clostridiisalibacter paucivorans]|uniref:hypothetical protein n=1 Tax=Clostridiisalibacter paucivorans TaxID=408753 RepID=UPI00047E8A9C|nr:hypothetical protein [Clostridiisalibacter paucivorans]